MEDPHHLLLQHRLQVDEEVAAAHQIEPGERRVLGQVLHREHDEVAHPPVDLVLPVAAGEVAGQPLLGDIGLDVGGVDPLPRLLDGRLVDIGAEHLDPEVGGPRSEELEAPRRLLSAASPPADAPRPTTIMLERPENGAGSGS